MMTKENIVRQFQLGVMFMSQSAWVRPMSLLTHPMLQTSRLGPEFMCLLGKPGLTYLPGSNDVDNNAQIGQVQQPPGIVEAKPGQEIGGCIVAESGISCRVAAFVRQAPYLTWQGMPVLQPMLVMNAFGPAQPMHGNLCSGWPDDCSRDPATLQLAFDPH